ncbi:MAG: NAD(P)H-dependent oxidoreductase subunit E [Candidatus Nanopelagicales bacterium]
MATFAPWSEESAEAVLRALPADERLILPALQRIQQAFGYVPEGTVALVARALNVSRAEVVGVLTYYHDLRQTPPASVVVQICVAEACQAEGTRELVQAIETAYDVTLGTETHVGDVEFDKVYCFGNCALGPAAMVNGRLLGRCDMARLAEAIAAAQGVRS